MKNNIKIFIGETLAGGICTFIGSILGNAFNNPGLFIGAMAGGIIGIILCTLLLVRIKVIEKNSCIPTIIWGTLFFCTASLFAVTNMNTPVIPLASLFLVGLGCVTGSSFSFRTGEYKSFNYAIIGFLVILPTLYFVIGSIIKYNLGFAGSFTLLDWLQNSPSRRSLFNIVSPFLFIGGTLVCIFLNSPASFRKGKILLSRNGMRIRKVNAMMALTSCLLLCMLTFYLLGENLN